MPFADTVFQDWDDCVFQDWDDCVWDKFSITYQDAKMRTARQFVEGRKQNPESRRRQSRNIRIMKNPQYEWRWVRYLDYSRWTATTGQWFDNRWLAAGVADSWVAHFDNTEWVSNDTNQLYWSTDKWIYAALTGAPGYKRLITIGNWELGYRPTAIRITWTRAVGSVTTIGWQILGTDHNFFYNDLSMESGDEETIPTPPYEFNYDIDYMRIHPGEVPSTIWITNIEFYGGIPFYIDLSVLPDTWFKELRPKKFRMKFNEATANVSLQDSNAVAIYANATYRSGDEVFLDFAGADIARLIVSGGGDLTDIEFLIRVEKDAYQRTMRKAPPGGQGNFRRPYLEGNPSYVEDNKLDPDTAIADARIRTTGEVRPHMTLKQPYRYEAFQKMKYQTEPALPYLEALPYQKEKPEPEQLLFPAPPAMPEPGPIPAPPAIPEPDPIPEPVPQGGCQKGTKPTYRAPSGPGNYVNFGYKCVNNAWVPKGWRDIRHIVQKLWG